MGTNTPKVGFYVPAVNEVTWHLPFQGGLETAENRLTLAGAGSPQGLVIGHWIGQTYFDTTIKQNWICTTATGVAATSVWELPVLINQATYDILLPVGHPWISRTGVAPTVPPGIVATWTKVTSDSWYMRIMTGAISDGGSYFTEPAGGHNHSNNFSVSFSGASVGDVNTPGPVSFVQNIFGIVGTLFGVDNHQHLMNLRFRGYAVWERTA